MGKPFALLRRQPRTRGRFCDEQIRKRIGRNLATAFEMIGEKSPDLKDISAAPLIEDRRNSRTIPMRMRCYNGTADGLVLWSMWHF